MNDIDKAAFEERLSKVETLTKNTTADCDTNRLNFDMFKSGEFEQLKTSVTLNMSMAHTLMADQQRMLGVAKDPDGNNVLTFEKGEIIVRDASGELVVKINNDITIGETYKNSPISAVREFMNAMIAYRALVSD